MRFLKTYKKLTTVNLFENLNQNEPEIGDYVIIYHEDFIECYCDGTDLIDFFRNNIGKLTQIGYNNELKSYKIKFDEYLPEYDPFCNSTLSTSKEIFVDKEDILRWSKNKEDLEILQFQQKYNL